jgi:hypothetical protein
MRGFTQPKRVPNSRWSQLLLVLSLTLDFSPCTRHNDRMVTKPKILPAIALVWSGILFSCSTSPPTAATKAFDYTNADGPFINSHVLTGLGSAFSIRAAANTWPALVQKVKPAFAWNGRDMMWIERDTNGSPRFVLDEAYVYQPTNQPRRWILVKDERRTADFNVWSKEDWWRQFSSFNLPALAELHDSTPRPNDGGGYGNYAVVKSKHPHFGEVYEIGWEREMSVGTAHPTYNRRLYVYRDSLKQWHFLGEGPEDGAERGGDTTTRTQVHWKEVKPPELPLDIQFTTVDTVCDPPDEEDDHQATRLTTCREFTLAPPFPSAFRETTQRPYVVAEKNDTLDKIAERLGYWQPGWKCYVDMKEDEKREGILKKQVLELWITGLARLNPQLPRFGEVKEGTRVEILTCQEVDKLDSNICQEKIR